MGTKPKNSGKEPPRYPLYVLFLVLQNAHLKNPESFIQRDDELESVDMEQRLSEIKSLD